VIGIQPGSDQVIGVKVKNFQPKSRKHVSNHFLFYKKSSKMQFSMILANLKKFSLFLFFSFWLPHPVFCTTLFRNGIFGFVIATLENTVEIRKAFAERRKKEKLTGILEKIFISNSINVGARV
jgi:hypothetical protein